jgi:hypothetical protein
MPFGDIMLSSMDEGAREVGFSWQAAQWLLKISAPFGSSIGATTGACTAAVAEAVSQRIGTKAKKDFICSPASVNNH